MQCYATNQFHASRGPLGVTLINISNILVSAFHIAINKIVAAYLPLILFPNRPRPFGEIFYVLQYSDWRLTVETLGQGNQIS